MNINEQIADLSERLTLIRDIVNLYNFDVPTKTSTLNNGKAEEYIKEKQLVKHRAEVIEYIMLDFTSLIEKKNNIENEIRSLQLQLLQYSHQPAKVENKETGGSPRSVSTERAQVGKLNEIMKKSNCEMLLNGQPIVNLSNDDLARLFFTSTDCHRIRSDLSLYDVNNILSFLGWSHYPRDEMKADPAKLSSLFGILSSQSEITLQKNKEFIEIMYGHLGYIDTLNNGSVFLSSAHPTISDRKAYVLRRTGKQDGIHRYGPCYMEIKGENYSHLAGLEQAIDRIVTSLSSYGVFDRHMVFVKEKQLSFILYYCQSEESRTVNIYPCTARTFSYLLVVGSMNFENNADWFYGRQSKVLLLVLRHLRVEFHSSQTLLIDSNSTSSIFKVIPPNEKGIVDSEDPNALAIKLSFRDIVRFENERRAVLRVTQYYRLHKLRSYLVAYYSPSDGFVSLTGETSEEPESETTNATAANTPGLSRDCAWFQTGNVSPHPNSIGSECHGAFIMLCGKPMQEVTVAVYEDILTSLRRIHDARVVHRDLRSTNILYFSQLQRHEVIDFDLAGCLEEGRDSIESQFCRYSSQGKAIPVCHRFKNRSGEDIVVQWRAEDDLMMWVEYAAVKLGNKLKEY